MQSKDKISKLTWNYFEAAKDTVKANLSMASNSNQITIDKNALPAIFSLIDASISEAYNKGHNNFVDNVLKNQDLKEIDKEKKIIKKK